MKYFYRATFHFRKDPYRISILCEFENEDNEVAVGYIGWLEEDNQEKVADIIENEMSVKINWPEKCDGVEPSKMKKKKARDIEWKIHSAKILAFGGINHIHAIISCCSVFSIMKCPLFYNIFKIK